MAYTSGMFFVNLAGGSDAARSALTSCTASNPSGSVTRINKTAHGLFTGAVVDLTLFTAWLNSAWKITKVDNDNFDLDGAVWQATADTSGTVTPRGGTKEDPWATVGSGATSARIQPGDEIGLAETANQVSLGQNATFTDESNTVTLTSAVTKKIEDAISGWTAATNITASTNASRKLGSTALVLTPASGFTTGKMAYATISGGGTQSFSSYQYINLWFRPLTATAYAASSFKICLCSDATGDTIVNEIDFPATISSTTWLALSLYYGGNLSASVQSVAIYAIIDPGTVAISINNIFASAGNLSLKTLIGKTGAAYYPIQSIDGTTIKLDAASTSLGGRGYSGTTSTETLYYRVPFYLESTPFATLNEAGDGSSLMTLSGGWNLTTGAQTGKTVIAPTLSGYAAFFNSSTAAQRWVIKNIWFARMAASSLQPLVQFHDCVMAGFLTITSSSLSTTELYFKNCIFLSCASGAFTVTGGNIVFNGCQFLSFLGSGIATTGGARFYSCIFKNNATSDIAINDGSDFGNAAIIARNCLFGSTTEVTISASKNSALWSFNHDQSAGDHWGIFEDATANWQTVEKQGSDPGAWDVELLASTRGAARPIKIYIGPYHAAASAACTVSVWVKKSHATNVGALLRIEDEAFSLPGISEATDTKADDTSWEQLSLTFTPTQKGSFHVVLEAYYVAGVGNIYIGSSTFTQA